MKPRPPDGRANGNRRYRPLLLLSTYPSGIATHVMAALGKNRTIKAGIGAASIAKSKAAEGARTRAFMAVWFERRVVFNGH